MKRNTGTSLLELVIASAVLISVVGMGMGVLLGSGKIASSASQSGHQEASGRQFTNLCKSNFRFALLSGTGPSLGGTTSLGILSDYTEVRFQVPVTPDEKGKVKFGSTSFIGMDDPDATNRICVIRFEPDAVLRESASANASATSPAASWGGSFPSLPTLSTVTLNLDLDGNGSLADTFLRGRVRKYDVSSQGAFLSVETLGDGAIFRVETSTSNPFKYNMIDPRTGETEPLVRFVNARGALVAGSNPGIDGRAIVVTLWNCSLDDNGKRFHLRKSSEIVRFRNPQQ